MLSREDYPDARLFHYPHELRSSGIFISPRPLHFPEHEYRQLVFDSDLPAMTWPEATGFGVDFASIASADGALDVRPFGNSLHRRAETGGQWTSNAKLCPTIVAWLEKSKFTHGSVRVLRKSNSILDLRTEQSARALFHRDTTNFFAETSQKGWILRLLVQLTDDPESYFLGRTQRDHGSEVQVSLTAGRQIVFDADQLWHTAWHPAHRDRYALLVSIESSPELDEWISQECSHQGAL